MKDMWKKFQNFLGKCHCFMLCKRTQKVIVVVPSGFGKQLISWVIWLKAGFLLMRSVMFSVTKEFQK